MFHRSQKRRLLIQRIVAYVVSTLAVLLIVTGAILFIQGYRLDSDHGRLEQGALLQFRSLPSGSTITIDGRVISSRTPAKYTVLSGKHSFTMEHDGYRPWAKVLDIKAGTLTWLDYIRLIPTDLQVSTVSSYGSLSNVKASPDRRFMLIQEKPDVATFDIVNLTSDTATSAKVSLPPAVYSGAANINTKHTFTPTSWDGSGRYVLVKHQYGGATAEWLVLDTQSAKDSKNVTKILDMDLDHLQFYGNSGKVFYGLSDGNVRKLDINAKTISATIIGKVKKFEINEPGVVAFVGTDASSSKQSVAGVYRDGHDSSFILKKVNTSEPLNITTARYRGDDYVAIATGKKVNLLKGDYPSGNSDDISSLKPWKTFDLNGNVEKLMFNSAGNILIARSGQTFMSYEIEYERLNTAALETQERSPQVQWLDNAYLWSSYDNRLTIREFDGTNSHVLNAVEPKFDAVLTNNGRFLYSINKSGDGYILQRATLIID